MGGLNEYGLLELDANWAASHFHVRGRNRRYDSSIAIP